MEQTGHALGVVLDSAGLLVLGANTSWDLVKHHDMGPCGAFCIGARDNRAVIIPQSSFNLPRWQELAVGDHIVVRDSDGKHHVGSIAWTSPTRVPLSVDEETLFRGWLTNPDQTT